MQNNVTSGETPRHATTFLQPLPEVEKPALLRAFFPPLSVAHYVM